MILISLPTLIFSQQKTKFMFGLQAKYVIYPGVNIHHESGADVMASRFTGNFMFGFDMQWDYLNKGRSLKIHISLGMEPNLLSLTMDWDKLGSFFYNNNTLADSYTLLENGQPIVHLDFTYKQYLKHKCSGMYFYEGLLLIMPMGINDEGKIPFYEDKGEIYHEGYLIINKQSHNIPYRPFYPGVSAGIGNRINAAFLAIDYSMGISFFKSYYRGTYETPVDAPIQSKGNYSQKSFLFEFKLTVFYNRRPKN